MTGELVQQTHLNPDQINAAVQTLEQHDVIHLEGDRYTYIVELMHRWVEMKQ